MRRSVIELIIFSGKEQTLTTAFRGKKRFLSLMLQESEHIDYGALHHAIRKRVEYTPPRHQDKVINFIIPLSGR